MKPPQTSPMTRRKSSEMSSHRGRVKERFPLYPGVLNRANRAKRPSIYSLIYAPLPGLRTSGVQNVFGGSTCSFSDRTRAGLVPRPLSIWKAVYTLNIILSRIASAETSCTATIIHQTPIHDTAINITSRLIV